MAAEMERGANIVSQLSLDSLCRVWSFLSLPDLLSARLACRAWRDGSARATHVWHHRRVGWRAFASVGVLFPNASHVRLVCGSLTDLTTALHHLLGTQPPTTLSALPGAAPNAIAFATADAVRRNRRFLHAAAAVPRRLHFDAPTPAAVPGAPAAAAPTTPASATTVTAAPAPEAPVATGAIVPAVTPPAAPVAAVLATTPARTASSRSESESAAAGPVTVTGMRGFLPPASVAAAGKGVASTPPRPPRRSTAGQAERKESTPSARLRAVFLPARDVLGDPLYPAMPAPQAPTLSRAASDTPSAWSTGRLGPPPARHGTRPVAPPPVALAHPSLAHHMSLPSSPRVHHMSLPSSPRTLEVPRATSDDEGDGTLHRDAAARKLAMSPPAVPHTSRAPRARLAGLSLGNVRVTDTALGHLCDIAAPLRELRLTGRWFVSRPAFASLLSHLFALRSLDVTGYQALSDADVATLVKACGATLRRFASDSCRLVAPLINFPLLESLSLGRCSRLTNPTLLAPRLEWLSMPYCRGVTADTLFDILAAAPALHYLDARACASLQDFTVDHAELRWLDLSICTGLRSLEVICPRLQVLRLCAVPCLRDVSLRLHAVEALDLSCLVALEGLEIVAPALRVLNLTSCVRLDDVVLTECTDLRIVYACGSSWEHDSPTDLPPAVRVVYTGMTPPGAETLVPPADMPCASLDGVRGVWRQAAFRPTPPPRHKKTL